LRAGKSSECSVVIIQLEHIRNTLIQEDIANNYDIAMVKGDT
jgi:hypothetical protein